MILKRVNHLRITIVKIEIGDMVTDCHIILGKWRKHFSKLFIVQAFNHYPTAFPYGNGMVLHFYQQQESSTTKTVHKVINKGLKMYV